MIIKHKYAVITATIVAVVFAIFSIGYYQSGTRSSGLLKFSSEDTGSKLAINDVAPNTRQPRSEISLKNVSETQSSDTVFLACTAEKFFACSKMQTVVSLSSITGSFLEQTQAILPLAKGSEIIDNCISDGISACSNFVIQKKIAAEPSVEICEEYTDPVTKQNCRNDVYPKVAIFKDDASVCNQITEEYGQKYCADTYNSDKSVKNRDISWCSRLSSTERQNECKSIFSVKVAIATDDIKFCAKSQDETQASACSQSFLMKKIESTSLESCKKTYDYTSFVSEKNVLDRIYQNCLSRLAGEILMSIRSDPNLLISKGTMYRQACGALPDMEKKVCLDQLTLVQSGGLVPPPRLDQAPASKSGTIMNNTGASAPVIAK